MSVSHADALADQIVTQLRAYTGTTQKPFGAVRTLFGLGAGVTFDEVERVDMATQDVWDMARTASPAPDNIAMVELPNISDALLTTGRREKTVDINIFAARRNKRTSDPLPFDPRFAATRAATPQRMQVILALAYDVEAALSQTPTAMTLNNTVTYTELPGRNFNFFVDRWDAVQIIMRVVYQHLRGDS